MNLKELFFGAPELPEAPEENKKTEETREDHPYFMSALLRHGAVAMCSGMPGDTAEQRDLRNAQIERYQKIIDDNHTQKQVDNLKFQTRILEESKKLPPEGDTKQ